MRLWSLHPQVLDRQGLLAVWREGLLAQVVLAGRTRGYRHHPQLIRFQSHPEPLGAIAFYLSVVQAEAGRRGYQFDESKIITEPVIKPQITVTQGQLAYEWGHLLNKLEQRSPADYERQAGREDIPPHPLFRVVPGGVAAWEKV